MGLLRKLFGPSREEIWRQLATEIGASYIDGGVWKGDKVEAKHGEWTITLDSYSVHTGKVTMVFTRLRAPYVNVDGFRFSVSRRGFLTGVATWLGAQDIEVGYPDFDRDFVIKGSSEEHLRRLFASDRLRRLLEAQPSVHFAVQDDEGVFGPKFPENVDQLLFVVGGVITDTARLKGIFDLFAATLERLTEMGSAYERYPGMKN